MPRRHRSALCTQARDAYPHNCPDRHCYIYAHRHYIRHRDSHTDGNSYSHRHPDSDNDTQHHAHAFCASYVDIHTLADLHVDAEPDAQPHSDPYPDSYADADSVPDGDSDADHHAVPDSMTDILPYLKSLASVSGLSAYEGPVARIIAEKWKPLVDEVSTSRLGSLHALKRGSGKGKRPSIMIATHMDAIGLIVNRIEDGFLFVDDIGGIDPRILPGTPVIVHGKKDLPGVVVMPPLKSLPEHARGGAVGLSHVLIDVGLLPSAVKSLVRVGDTVSFDTQPVELAGEALSGHSLDNRASLAALTVCLEDLQAKTHAWDVWAVATVQEEETLGGAATSAFHLQPDLAVAVDVTFAKGPGANGWQTFAMGKGPTLGWGANLHPFLFERFKELADRLEIPVSTDLTPAHSGTDAHAIQVAREGIPTMLLGIPLRYMHTPVEMVATKDVLRAGRLLSEFICGLGLDFISEITWEEKSAE